MTLEGIYDYLTSRLPVEQIPLTWDSTGYTSEAFNEWASDPDFPGWEGDRPAEEEVRVIVELLKARPGDSILDVACGYGRHALLLADVYGLRVTGIDISPGLIATAKRFAAEKQLEIERIYSQEEILNLLSSCGFQVDGIYGGWDLSLLSESSTKMLLAATKK